MLSYTFKAKWKNDKKGINELAKLGKGKTQIKIGLPDNGQTYPNTKKPVSVVLVGTVQEFGSATRNIPERSFLRSTLLKNKTKYKGYLRKLLWAKVKTAAKGFSNAEAIGELKARQIGEKVKGDVQETLTNLTDPPNADSTIAKKGSSNPLIDTGFLRSSITYTVEKKK